MTKIIVTLLFVVSLFSAASLKAQSGKVDNPSYKTAVGAVFFPFGISIKSMTNKKNAIELLGYFKEGFRITGLYEYHGVLNQDGNIKWYIGGGAHAGFADKSHGSDVKLGADGIIGVEYKFMRLPLNLTLDWQPSLGIGDNSSFIANWGGIGARFCF